MAEVDLSKLSEKDRASVLAHMQAGRAGVHAVNERKAKGKEGKDLIIAVRGNTRDGVTAVDNVSVRD